MCSLLALYGALCLVEMGPRKALGALKPVVSPTHRCGAEVGFWPAVRVGLLQRCSPLALSLGSWMSGLLPWAAPLSWDGEVVKVVLVECRQDPEADDQGTEKSESRRS